MQQPETTGRSLFVEVDLDEAHATRHAAPAGKGPVVAVAIEQSVDKSLDYLVPPKFVERLRVGQRVRVPLGRGNKPARGYVIAIKPTSDFPKLKSLIDISDERVLVGGKMMELALWMARYYCAPLGAVIDSIIPSAVKKQIGLGYVAMVRPIMERSAIQDLLERTRGSKRRAVLARLLQIPEGQREPLEAVASDAGVKPPTVRKLATTGLIAIDHEPDLGGLVDALTPAPADERPHQLNAEQQRVFDGMLPKLSSEFSVSLLHGITGSGKTEVYLRCIAEVVKAGKQAIVMVPEIALTPQTVRRFTMRFPHVAVLHSGLTASQRHRYWQQISTGQAQVIVGARSAVFAPTKSLGMIVVDEEHEASYKQDQQPRYQGRDVAIKRAQLESVPVLLGSATPSLEMWERCARASGEPSGSTYELFALTRRARAQPLPAVEVVDMKTANRERKGVHLLSPRLEAMLQATVAQGHQAILLLNRRGYSNFVYCGSCGEALKCDYCDTTMTFHRSAGAEHERRAEHATHSGQLHCHYCLAVKPLPPSCPVCNKRLSLFGLGTQRVEEEIARKFPKLRFARVDSDSMHSSKDYEKTLEAFGRREFDLMLGTQMIAKGLDYPNVTLVGVISADTALALPDFRASERTFQLITQVAGRAGRGDLPGRVIVQSFQPDQPAIVKALAQDFPGFASEELVSRREVGLPPYARMARIVLRDQEEAKLQHRIEQLAVQAREAIAGLGEQSNQIRLTGPMPCSINRIANYWRHQLLLTARSPMPIQLTLARLREQSLLSAGDRVAVDVDPVSLL